jgi:hypothetical protein
MIVLVNNEHGSRQMDETPPTREELLRARDALQRQLKMIRNPARSADRSRPLEAKLRAMLDEIEKCLAAMETDGGKGA